VGEGDDWFGDPAVPGQLVKAFASWSRRWHPICTDGDFDWHSFNAEGIRLATSLKANLGPRFRIIYARPYEEPNVDPGHRLLEISVRGTRPYVHRPYWADDG
jgi:hypothetical protein